MTFTVLRALHDIIGEALDDIERVYQAHGQDPAANVDGGDRDSKLSANASSPPASPRSSYAYSSYSKVSGTGKSPGATFRHKASLSSGSLGMICKAYVSPPPSPCVTTVREQRFEHEMGARPRPTSAFFSAPEVPLPPTPGPVLDFPSLDAPFDATSPSETLTSHPAVMAAINRIISACGQMAATVQTPFLTICDSTMGYHLPSCMRIVEAAHVVEILREHGPPGMHVDRLSQLCSIDASKLAHILRLLATHHIFKEVSPDVFGLNRISSLIDSGKNVDQLVDYRNLGQPELKYQGTNGISAFVGLCSDEINKASSYMTETYLLSSSPRIREANQPTLAPFCLAFGAVDRNVDYFGWLEGQNDKQAHNSGTELGHGSEYSPAPGLPDPLRMSSSTSSNEDITHSGRAVAIPNLSRFRLERFGKAMSGTGSWEAPGAVFGGFNWRSLPRGSVIVDVGGGIGSTSMMLATTFSPPTGEDLGFKFVIQDRAVVVDMGEKAWKDKCPALLESGTARFQVHDFFTPQPIRDAAVFLLRVVMHDWPDDHARKILLHLREAATSQTKLLLADFVLPLACADDFSSDSANGLGLEEVEGAQRVLAPAPLLPNLGKASANVYWMDLTMNVMFNSRERTLREIVLLALSAGWKVVKVTQAPGSLFGYIVAVPVKVGGGGGGGSADEAPSRARGREDMEMAGKGDEVETRSKAELKCLAVADALAKFGGGVKRFRGPGTIGRGLGGSGKEGDKVDRGPVTSSSSSSSLGSSSSSAASPLKPAASLEIVKKRSLCGGGDLVDVEGRPIMTSTSTSTVGMGPRPVSSNAPVAQVAPPPSPSPINLQIASAPPIPPRSLRRPSSLANLKASNSRSMTLASPAPEVPVPVPPLPPSLPSLKSIPSLDPAALMDSAASTTRMAEDSERKMDGSSRPGTPTFATLPTRGSLGSGLRGRTSFIAMSTTSSMSSGIMEDWSLSTVPSSPMLPTSSSSSQQRPLHSLRTSASVSHFATSKGIEEGSRVGASRPGSPSFAPSLQSLRMRSSVSQHFRTPSSTSSKMEKPIRPDSPILTHAPQRLAQGLRARASVSHFPASPPVRRSDERIGAPGVGRAESPAQPPYVRRVAQGVRARASVSHFPTPRGVGDRLGGAGPLVSSSRPASPAQPISMISQGLRTRASVPCLPQPSTMGHGHTPTLVRFSSQPPAPQSLIPVPKSRLGAAGSGAGQQGYAAGKQQIGMVQHGASVCLNVAPPPIDDPEVVPANGKRERRVSFKSLSAARRASSVQLGVSYRMGGGVGEGGIGSSPISGAKALGSPLFARGEKRERVASYLKGAGQRLGGILRFDGRGDAEREKGNLNGKGDSGIGEKELKKSSVPALGGVRAGLGLGSTARVDRPRR